MDVRQRRLNSDREALLDLARDNAMISVDVISGSGDRYRVRYRCKGLLWLPGLPRPSITTQHELEVYLHVNYPRLPPRLQWLTDIFHPNILPPAMNGGVCIGRWTPSERLDRLVVRIGEMVQYKNYSAKDALNLQAAAWAEQNALALPVDDAPLLGQSDPLGITIGAQ